MALTAGSTSTLFSPSRCPNYGVHPNRLVGANNYGFNTIYIKDGIGEDILPAVSVESILQHPRNIERQKRFKPIKDWDYIHV
jgi:hypothetical protein